MKDVEIEIERFWRENTRESEEKPEVQQQPSVFFSSAGVATSDRLGRKQQPNRAIHAMHQAP